MAASGEPVVSFQIRWNSRSYTITLHASSTLASLKENLAQVTNVLPHRQKILSVKHRVSGKSPTDATLLGDISGKTVDGRVVVMMVGTAENDIIVYDVDKEESDLLNDLDIDYSVDDHALQRQYAAKIRTVADRTVIDVIHPLREGKPLLVLDLDYTLFDMKSTAANFLELKRPYTDQFLTTAYRFFDLCVWSQTSWTYLEIKLTELGLLTHSDYRISFVLDKTAMFSIDGVVGGKKRKHQVKPLDLIWGKLSKFDATNTLHIDDLSRNFALNPKNGLKISAFKNAHISRHSDQELVFLARYLELIASHRDFSKLDHKKWKSRLAEQNFNDIV